MTPPEKPIITFRSQLIALARRLRGESGLDAKTYTEVAVLSAIEAMGETATPTLLAHRERYTSSNMAAMLRKLDEQQLIQRHPDKHDKRKTLLSLTAHGQQALRDTRARRDQWLIKVIEEKFSPEEQQILIMAGTLMQRITESD